MKIMICSNIYPPNFVGGAELIAHYQAQELIKKGHEVIIFAGEDYSAHNRYDVWEDVYDNLRIFRIKLSVFDYKMDGISFFHKEVELAFEDLINSLEPQIVHFHNLIGLSLGIIIIAKMKGIKTFITFHDNWGICYKNTLLKYDDTLCKNFEECMNCLPFIYYENNKIPFLFRKDYFKYIFSFSDHFISPSGYIAEIYRNACYKKINQISNSVDINKFEKIRTGRPLYRKKIRFSFIGYLGRHKGVHILMEAIQLIKNKKHIIFNIVGDGDLRRELEETAENKKIGKLVKFWGKIDNKNIDQVFKNTDVYILPSVCAENQPVSITEAMACGLPVIGSKIGGIPELIEDNITGMLFEPNDPADLARKIDFFIKNKQLINEYGDAGYNKILKYDFPRQVDKIINLYKDNKNHQRPEYQIVSCIGSSINDSGINAINMIKADKSIKNILFVKNEWITCNDKDVIIAWITDINFDHDDIIYLLKNNICILAPECIKTSKDIFYGEKSIIYYYNQNDVSEYLKFLINIRNPDHEKINKL